MGQFIIDFSVHIIFLNGNQKCFLLLFFKQRLCIFRLLLDHDAFIYFLLSLLFGLHQLCFKQCYLLSNHSFYLVFLFRKLLLERLHPSFVLHVVLHYGSFHWVVAWLPPHICCRLEQPSTCRAITPSAFVHLRSASGWIVAFASQMRGPFGSKSWKSWKRTCISL